MKKSISKECFIKELENDLLFMSRYVDEDKECRFDVVLSNYSVLVDFAYINGLFTDDEYCRYNKFQYCRFSKFASTFEIDNSEK